MWGEFCEIYSPNAVKGYKINSYLIVFGVNTDLDPVIVNIKQDINRPNNQDDYEIITYFLIDNYGERIWDTCQVIELDACENINL